MTSSDAKYQQLIKHRFYNRFPTITDFYKELSMYKFDNPELVRPTFDTYFMRLAELAASRSGCMKEGNGSIIAKDCRVVSTGYNGTPLGIKNCQDGGCLSC